MFYPPPCGEGRTFGPGRGVACWHDPGSSPGMRLWLGVVHMTPSSQMLTPRAFPALSRDQPERSHQRKAHHDAFRLYPRQQTSWRDLCGISARPSTAHRTTYFGCGAGTYKKIQCQDAGLVRGSRYVRNGLSARTPNKTLAAILEGRAYCQSKSRVGGYFEPNSVLISFKQYNAHSRPFESGSTNSPKRPRIKSGDALLCALHKVSSHTHSRPCAGIRRGEAL